MKLTKLDNHIMKTSDINRKQKKKTKNFKMHHRIKELEQQKIIFKELYKNLSQKLECMNEIHNKEHNHREKLQQDIIFNALNDYSNMKEIPIDDLFSILSQELNMSTIPMKDNTYSNLKDFFENLEKKTFPSSNQHVSGAVISKKMDVDNSRMNMKRSDFTKIMLNAIDKIYPSAYKNGTWLIHSIPNGVFILCDSRKIFQAIVTLLKNSLNSVPKGTGTIRINLREGKEMEITIKDNRIVMPKDEILQLFSKFNQTYTPSTQEKDSAVFDLYVCKQVINAHNGRIWIESKKDGGTILHIILPNIKN